MYKIHCLTKNLWGRLLIACLPLKMKYANKVLCYIWLTVWFLWAICLHMTFLHLSPSLLVPHLFKLDNMFKSYGCFPVSPMAAECRELPYEHLGPPGHQNCIWSLYTRTKIVLYTITFKIKLTGKLLHQCEMTGHLGPPLLWKEWSQPSEKYHVYHLISLVALMNI